MKEFDSEEFAKCNGENGNPIYIVYREKVFDVGASKRWKGGVHMRRHRAGMDLSTEIQAAPHGPEVLERFPQVGVLKKAKEAELEMPAALVRLLKRYPLFAAPSSPHDGSFSDRFHVFRDDFQHSLPADRRKVL